MLLFHKIQNTIGPIEDIVETYYIMGVSPMYLKDSVDDVFFYFVCAVNNNYCSIMGSLYNIFCIGPIVFCIVVS